MRPLHRGSSCPAQPANTGSPTIACALWTTATDRFWPSTITNKPGRQKGWETPKQLTEVEQFDQPHWPLIDSPQTQLVPTGMDVSPWQRTIGGINKEQDHHQGRKGRTVIDYKTPDLSNPGLGFKHCSDGNQTHQYKDILSKIQEVCSAVSAVHLTIQNMRQSKHSSNDSWPIRCTFPASLKSTTGRSMRPSNVRSFQ